MEETEYNTGEFKLNKGDILLLQTDGVYETMNPKNQLFTFDRVKELLLAHKESMALDINKHIVSEVERFRGDNEQQDDITLITLKKLN